ncbi:TOBE domain-containing protein [Mesobacterium pallidum]|uniref:TOBE domain-containing protein n=1 Tax=Mesobacterium pallidum TaxID=2872037 RepID=UPI001EE3966A|nr:transporter [Mesobacterium pallidum]
MKLIARTKLAGTARSIDTGAVNSTERIDLGGAAVVTATITNALFADPGLVVGWTACAIVKASDVLARQLTRRV